MTVRYKFILQHMQLGSKQINEPIGWEEATFKLNREDTHDVLSEYSTELGFYGADGSTDGGRDYLRQIIASYGIDTEVELELYVSPGTRQPFEFEKSWTLNLEDYEYVEDPELGNVVYANIQQKGFLSAFNERKDTKVNFTSNTNLDGGAMLAYNPHQLTLHSREISKNFEGRFNADSIFHGGIVSTTPETRLLSATVGWPVVNDELNDFFSLGSGFLSNQQRVNFFEAKEEGNYVIDLNLNATLKIDRIQGDFDIVRWQWIFQKNEDPATILNERYDTGVSGYQENLSASYSNTVNLKLGDKLYFYANIEIRDVSGNVFGFYQFNPVIKYLAGSYMTISAVTTVPENTINCQLIHDAFSKVCDAITGVNNSFYSEYLGNTQVVQRNYNANGEFSYFALASGAQLRNLNDRELSISFKELYDNLNAITPVGIGLDTINGNQVIRLEHISHFYDTDSVLTLNKIEGMKTSIAKEKYYKTIEVGYSKGLPEDVGGLNEPNVKKEYATVLKSVGRKGSFVSNFIASGSLLEQQRRESADSKDARYDKDVFIIALNRSNLSIAEKDENYSVVTNLDNPSTIYNLRLSPAMNLLRQGPVINSGLLKKIGTNYTPTTNEGNFKMITTSNHTDAGNFDQQPLDESAPIKWNYGDLTEVKPLFKPFIREFSHPLSFSDYKLLGADDGRKKAITISTDGETFYKVFILDLEYKPSEAQANFKVIEANEVPIEIIDENIGFLKHSENGYIIYEAGGRIMLN